MFQSYFPNVVSCDGDRGLRFHELFMVVAAPEREVTRTLFTIYKGVSYGVLPWVFRDHFFFIRGSPASDIECLHARIYRDQESARKLLREN